MGFLGSSGRIINKIFSPVISTSNSKELHQETKLGKVLSLFIREHFHDQMVIENISFHLKVSSNKYSVFK